MNKGDRVYGRLYDNHRHLVDVVTIRQRHHPRGMSTSITIVTRNAVPGIHDVAGQQILMLDFRPEPIEIVGKVVGKAGAEIDLATMEIGPAAPTAISTTDAASSSRLHWNSATGLCVRLR